MKRYDLMSTAITLLLFFTGIVVGQEPRVAGLDETVFVRAELDRDSAYPGQQVTLSYRLYTQSSIPGIQLLENPPLDGFLVEDIAVEANPRAEQLPINGRTYHVVTVKKQALFPALAGKLSIPSSLFAVSVHNPGNVPGLPGRPETLYRETAEQFLEVQPLPDSGRPDGFAGAVGTFSLAAAIDRNSIPAGDGIALRVRLEGQGNLLLMPDIIIPDFPGIRVFPSGRSQTIFPSERDVIGGGLTWDYVLVPEMPGPHMLPPLSFSFFDADRGEYATVTTGEISFRVEPVQEDTPAVTDRAADRAPHAFPENTAPEPNVRSTGFPRWIFPAAAILLAVIAGGSFLNKYRVSPAVPEGASRRRSDGITALRRLSIAEREAGDNSRRFYDRMANILSAYLADTFAMAEIELTGDTLYRRLRDCSIPPETIREIIACFRECDYRRFVGTPDSPDTVKEFSQRVRGAIEALEAAAGDRGFHQAGRMGIRRHDAS
jgi:hypothetical protein